MVETLLAWISSGEIAIPEIQRPFVWDKSKVRDLIDSLYKGFPIGYIIAWKNPDIRLKDGTKSEGKKVLIDGQQRITALSASLIGNEVLDDDYKITRIKIAFHPVEERFEVFNTAISKDKEWIHDISAIISGQTNLFTMVREYCEKNPSADETLIGNAIESLRGIIKKPIGMIELSPDLDIETVTEIFIRINSKGVVLSQADFAMSKIASNERNGGHVLRKAIDYFCHLAVAPEFYNIIMDNDSDFTETDYFSKMRWLKDENDDIYNPDYSDMLRVAFTSEFNRGKLADLVSLLSGRNFETRTYEEEIANESFERLGKAITRFMNETDFKRFVMIITSAGFISSGLIRSQNVLNFAYVLYLKMRSQGEHSSRIERFVRKWFVMSILTSRYTGGSPEGRFDFDIKQIQARGVENYLLDIESAELSEAFWNASLVQSLNTSVASSPYFNTYLAAQVYLHDKGFLSRDISVADLIRYRGDVHHIFPRDLLKRKGLKRGQYNQIANYVYMQSDINIHIGNQAPKDYFGQIIHQCETGTMKYGNISDTADLYQNIEAHCIPKDIFDMTTDDYQKFLEMRRKLIANKLRLYYESL
ncbi:GmrSD restriction endonuclease domain-containing protein [Spirochaeta africana]|nr:DUF262 domain-containing protein [Spirochaeta africana]